MKIGIDLQATKGRRTGLGVYTENFVRVLKSEISHPHEIFYYSKQINRESNTLERWYWENVELPARALQDHLELLHVPAFAPPYFKRFRLVVTVHDLIGMIFPNQVGLPSRLYWGKWLPLAIQRADAIIADSENTKKDVIKYLEVPERLVRIIYPSGHENFSPLFNEKSLQQLRNRLGIKEKYFLCVGTIEPRKNLDRVIEAFIHFLKLNKAVRYQLVVVGSKEFGHGKIFKELASDPVVKFDDVIFTGYVKHTDLNLLYCGTEAFLFPSLYEGFGIPVLEAMASGVPVLTSKLSSLPEVAGVAAYYVDPYDATQILEGMRQLADDPLLRKELREKGFKQVQKFSWKQTVQQTLEVYTALS